MTDDPYDAALDEITGEITRRLTDLVDVPDGTLLSEWVLVVATVEPDGTPGIAVVTSPTALLSHTLGALEYGSETVRERIRSEVE